ncbi:endoglucanase [Mycena pura]|uniref:cellulase n=1 Tax=Mycena pura TaxID=153505 RepID=A0AAD6YC10_9AGAR|nr:endoglucanase [Mycena pura]
MAYRVLYPLAIIVLSAHRVYGQAVEWGQSWHKGWTGPTTCVTGTTFYSQCLPALAVSGTVATPSVVSTPAATTHSSTTVAAPTHSSTTVAASTHSSTVTSTTTAVGSSTSCAPNSPAPGSGTLKFTGFDFGCNSDGSCTPGAAWPPLTQFFVSYCNSIGNDGAGQMKHFVNDDGYNTFRLPVAWQYLTGYVLGAPVNSTNLAIYDALVQIIGQGGPTNAQFAATWGQIAAFYKDEPKVIFGVMNEPHDVPDINLWAGSVQAAVTAIRNAGATTQIILLPGNNWTSAQTFVSNGSADALKKVVNPDGSITNLIFDVHKYLDFDNSGTNPECVTNNIEDSWAPLAQWLRCNGRQAFNTETGGGYNTASCMEFMCQQIAFQAQNSDVFLGYVGWAAGNFYVGYVLSELPALQGTTWVDTPLVSTCMAPIAGAQKGSTGL